MRELIKLLPKREPDIADPHIVECAIRVNDQGYVHLTYARRDVGTLLTGERAILERLPYYLVLPEGTLGTETLGIVLLSGTHHKLVEKCATIIAVDKLTR